MIFLFKMCLEFFALKQSENITGVLNTNIEICITPVMFMKYSKYISVM